MDLSSWGRRTFDDPATNVGLEPCVRSTRSRLDEGVKNIDRFQVERYLVSGQYILRNKSLLKCPSRQKLPKKIILLLHASEKTAHLKVLFARGKVLYALD